MTEGFDLSAYFERIGYGGEARPNLETLAAIQAYHVAAIPFEGVDPFLGRPVSLELDALQAKLVGSRRGGYCFEHNILLRAALRRIGFRTVSLGARVLVEQWPTRADDPAGSLPPRGHMVLQVDLPEGRYIADVGPGSDAPLRLETATLQTTTFGAVLRFDDAGEGAYRLAVGQADNWRQVLHFTLEAMQHADYEVANWFYSTHRQSAFTHTVIARRQTAAARYELRNALLVERRPDGGVIERTIESAAELADVLDTIFGIDPPAPAEEIFAKMTSR